ncbi:hypothetical protein LCGC14_1079830 [marine sediment metagenome]|uniref:Uncharacterized protein n=1 Tax=marine sediment metagenome TaxID=412755 RepID=A0A0F9PYN2_9ZZZZ
MEKYLANNLAMDLTQDGLAMIFRDYAVVMLEHLWRSTGDTIPVSMPPEASSRELHIIINEKLPPTKRGGQGRSRASIIKAADRFVDAKLWDCREESCKGGYRRIYWAIVTEGDLWKAVKKRVDEKLAQV